MKKSLLFLVSSIFVASNALGSYNQNSDNMVLKFRGLFNSVNAKQSSLPTAYTPFAKSNPQSVGKLYSMGYGAEASVSVFLNEFFAGEFSSGLNLYKSKSTAMKALAVNYNTSPSVRKKKDLFMIPAALTLQYHVAPYGALRPYVGGGYHYSYMMPKAEEYKIKNGSGPVLQAGLDFIFTDDTYINLDVKQYFLSTKIRYNRSFISSSSGDQVTSKIKLDPLSVGLGIGFRL